VRTVEEHLAAILAVVGPLSPLEVPLGEAHGCALAEDVVAGVSLPGFDNSAMDGYAVRRDDLTGASEADPVSLTVSGNIAAGAAASMRVQPGFCVRIMTGAPVPDGADAVVPQEWTDLGAGRVAIRRMPPPGAHIRRAGEDLRAGDLVLATGTPLGAAQLGLVAASGRARVRIQPRPRVVVMSTGSELREPGQHLGPGQIYDSNSHALAAAAKEAGALVYRVSAVPDEAALFTAALEDHLIRADAVVTSGGVSVGEHDVVKEVLSRLGTVDFVPVAMQPGRPQGFGTVGAEAVPFFGLPGNPVSALVSFEVFVRPALRRMLGAEPLLRPQVRARWVGGRWSSPAGRRQFVRAHLERDGAGYRVRASGGEGSHLMAGMAAANALAVVAEDRTEVADGDELTVMLLERRVR
jgi:molybdopterin molybdotransferase